MNATEVTLLVASLWGLVLCTIYLQHRMGLERRHNDAQCAQLKAQADNLDADTATINRNKPA